MRLLQRAVRFPHASRASISNGKRLPHSIVWRAMRVESAFPTRTYCRQLLLCRVSTLFCCDCAQITVLRCLGGSACCCSSLVFLHLESAQHRLNVGSSSSVPQCPAINPCVPQWCLCVGFACSVLCVGFACSALCGTWPLLVYLLLSPSCDPYGYYLLLPFCMSVGSPGEKAHTQTLLGRILGPFPNMLPKPRPHMLRPRNIQVLRCLGPKTSDFKSGGI